MKSKLQPNQLTGPEYEMIYNLLEGLLHYKKVNEGDNFFGGDLKEKNFNRTPVFTTLYSKEIIQRLVDKMGRRMDEFNSSYRRTCW
jgi:hypothetical protein